MCPGSRVYDAQWGMVFCKLIVLQTLGWNGSCAGPSVGMPVTPQHTLRVLLHLLSLFKSLPTTFGRQRPGSGEWRRWGERPRRPWCNWHLIDECSTLWKRPISSGARTVKELRSTCLWIKSLETLCFLRGGENYFLCISLLKIKMQRQYFHIEKTKQKENSFKLFRGEMNREFPIRLKYLKH